MTTTVHTASGGLSGWEATTALARLSLRRVLRGKALWIALGMGLLPCALAIILAVNDNDPTEAWDLLLGKLFMSLLAIVPPMLIASSLSDEIDDKTASYLWSRALPRWSVVTGKLLGLVPIAAVPIALGMLGCWLILGSSAAIPAAVFGRSVLGMVAGVVGASAISAMVAVLAPRFAVPLAMGWLFLDVIIGALSVNIHVIAVTFGPRAMARGEDLTSGVISLVVITAIALVVAVRRVDRIE